MASGLEVGYEHYKGSYSNPVMYTPVVLSGALAGASLLGAFNRKAARTILRWVSVATLADGIIGFFFHVRGVARKPGGWSLPVTNIVMGPPIFAPLLFGTSAYLGLMASYLRREEDLHGLTERFRKSSQQEALTGEPNCVTDVSKNTCRLVTVLWAFFSGFEALYSHYKTNFRYKAQWTPVLLGAFGDGRSRGSGEEPPHCEYRLADRFGFGSRRWGCRFLLPCARYRSQTRGRKKATLQHTLRPSYLCPSVVRRVRIPRPDGQSSPKGEEMTRKSFPFLATGGELKDLEQPGYYAGYSTMAQKKSWEEATRKTVTERVEKTPAIRFFSARGSRVARRGDRSCDASGRSRRRTHNSHTSHS